MMLRTSGGKDICNQILLCRGLFPATMWSLFREACLPLGYLGALAREVMRPLQRSRFRACTAGVQDDARSRLDVIAKMQLSRSRAHTVGVQDDARSRLNVIAKMQLSRSRVCIEAEHRGNAC